MVDIRRFCIFLGVGKKLFFETGPHYAAHTGPELLGLSNPSSSASRVAGTTGVCHLTWLSLRFLKYQYVQFITWILKYICFKGRI
jgi:hypothetical protein